MFKVRAVDGVPKWVITTNDGYVLSTNQVWFNRKEAARYLASIGCPVSANTLERMACNNNAGGGPAYTRIRWKIVQYAKADLDDWAKKQLVRVM
jgi:hypothetical protein